MKVPPQYLGVCCPAKQSFERDDICFMKDHGETMAALAGVEDMLEIILLLGAILPMRFTMQ